MSTLIVFVLNIILPKKTIEEEAREREMMDRQ